MDQIYDAAFTQLNESGSTLAAPALVNAAISGMLASLDPHSSYMDGKAFHDMQVQTRGEFGGVGMEVTMKDGLVQVVAPLEGTPAERAGILAGDLITLINESSVQGLSLTDAVTKLRGPVGSTVRVTITRAGQASPLIVPITRDIVRVRAVRSSIEGGDIGYIRITQFNEQTSDGLKKAIADVASQGGSRLRGIVLDLRNNPGGLLDQAVKVADEFLERGEIVSTRGRDPGDVQRFAAKAGDGLKGKPMVVLINGGSASGTEIVAAALQDHKRATVMGSRSFGKGTVQTIIPLGADKGALRLTTARYVSSTGRAIENGIQPDIEVLQDAPAGQKQDATAAGGKPGLQAYVPPDRKDDKALARAVDALRAVSSRAAPARR